MSTTVTNNQGTQLALFKGGAMPAHVAAFNDQHSNIADRETVPTLSYPGKVWTITLDGNAKQIMRKNSEGEEEPQPVIRVVILDYNKRRGRAYYIKGYDPKKIASPDCWSEDGIMPNVKVPADKKQCDKCGDCKMSAKGSKVTDSGKAVVACGEHRMLALVPAHDLDFTPLRMKIAITSDWDGQNEEQAAKGWFGFSNMINVLRQNGVKHTGMMITKMKFDPKAEFPKVMFSPADWLDAGQLEKVAEIAASDVVQKLLSATWTPAVPNVAPEVPPDEPEVELPAQTAPVARKAPAAVVEPEDDTDEDPPPPVAALKTSARPATITPKATAKVVEPEDDAGDDDDATANAAKVAQVAAAEAARKKAAKAAQAATAAVAKKAAPSAPGDDDDESGDVPPPAKPPVANPTGKKTNGTKPTAAPPEVSAIIEDWA